MNLKLDLPTDLFDGQYSEDAFAARMRELAILELVRAKRLHEHEAKELLGIERWELVAKMKAAGVAPTEDLFAGIQDELKQAIAARRDRIGKKGD
jgi:hypothetical protein